MEYTEYSIHVQTHVHILPAATVGFPAFLLRHHQSVNRGLQAWRAKTHWFSQHRTMDAAILILELSLSSCVLQISKHTTTILYLDVLV